MNVVKKALVRVGFLRRPATCWCCEKRPMVLEHGLCQQCEDLLESLEVGPSVAASKTFICWHCQDVCQERWHIDGEACRACKAAMLDAQWEAHAAEREYEDAKSVWSDRY